MRHLAEVGLLTSMDGDLNEPNTYLVGLSLDFIDQVNRDILSNCSTKLEAYHYLSIDDMENFSDSDVRLNAMSHCPQYLNDPEVEAYMDTLDEPYHHKPIKPNKK